MYPRSMADSDCVVIQGSNMAECHPVAFRWPMQAKLKGAKLIHVDPRFTRTSAVADIHAPIRAGSDVAFLGGLIRYVLESERWKTDPFFREFVVNYTNAATILADDFKETEDAEGVFSGLMQYAPGIKEWPLDGFVGQYDTRSWRYAAAAGHASTPPAGPPFDPLVRSLLTPLPRRDATLADPRTVFQIVKRHFSRYTPEMVEQVTGCPKETFLKVAETILANSGRERTTSFAYAVAWTQHTNGPQTIGCCALLQLLLGHIGRPGAGVMALRGHASIQGSTDIPTLYHSIHGYMNHPSALKPHGSLRDWLHTETTPRGYWANTPKFMVSYLKSMYGAAATKENDFGYDWHPKIIGDHSHLPMFVAMNEGRVRGMLCIGQNPATSLNASVERKGLARLEWLVVKDNWLTETATFWQNGPEITRGRLRSQDIDTEVFFFPSAQVAEYEGSFTNTQRMLQWHYKAAEPPGECRTDLWLTHQLAKRLKTMYANSTLPRDAGFKNLVWEFDSDDPHERERGEPDAHKILREINGYHTDEPGRHLAGFGELKAPLSKAAPDAIGLDALSGSEPFIMKPDGVGWLYVPSGLIDGPLPAHYEPAESPVPNPLYRQQSSPVLKYWKLDGNKLAPTGDRPFPYIITPYRLTEHYLSGAMSRLNPRLTELQPESFVEISPELAAEKGIGNNDWVAVSTPRGRIRAKALVTRRMRAFTIDGRTVHHVGMPFHWGYQGLSTGDAANELTALVGDPNVSIHEGKAFMCNVEKA